MLECAGYLVGRVRQRVYLTIASGRFYRAAQPSPQILTATNPYRSQSSTGKLRDLPREHCPDHEDGEEGCRAHARPRLQRPAAGDMDVEKFQTVNSL